MDINLYLTQTHSLRNQIADLDLQLLSLLERRIDLSRSLIAYKQSQGKSAYEPIVEDDKITTLLAKAKYPDLIKIIWPLIFMYCRLGTTD